LASMFAACSCFVLILDRSSLLWNLAGIIQDLIVNKMDGWISDY